MKVECDVIASSFHITFYRLTLATITITFQLFSSQFRSHPLYEAMRKQSYLLASTLAVDADLEVEVTGHNPMTPIPESAATASKARKRKATPQTTPDKKSEASGGTKLESDSTAADQPDETPLKRGMSKRRSL